MDTVLLNQVNEAIAGKRAWKGLAAEEQLRVAASMLSHSRDVLATRVVGPIGPDDHEALCHTVADISDEFELNSKVEFLADSYAVRFWRN